MIFHVAYHQEVIKLDIDYKLLGKRLKKIRKSQKLSQEVLAEMADISNQYLSNIETSRSIPSLETVAALCRSLNITPNDLLMGVDSASEEYLVPDIVNRLKQCTPAEKRLIVGFVDLLEKERKR